VQRAPGNAEHHRAVPPEQGLEGRLVGAGDEPAQQVGVSRLTLRPPCRESASAP
jgi:hypothetical protein